MMIFNATFLLHSSPSYYHRGGKIIKYRFVVVIFEKKREINGRNSDNFAKRKMVKIATFSLVALGNQKEQNKQQQIFTANTENSFGETTPLKSVGE